jgi:hypothetical protein
MRDQMNVVWPAKAAVVYDSGLPAGYNPRHIILFYFILFVPASVQRHYSSRVPKQSRAFLLWRAVDTL